MGLKLSSGSIYKAERKAKERKMLIKFFPSNPLKKSYTNPYGCLYLQAKAIDDKNKNTIVQRTSEGFFAKSTLYKM